MLSAPDLLAGSRLTFDIEIPRDVLRPGADAPSGADLERTVKLRPLTVEDLQVTSRAAQENDDLLAVLMVQRALVEPSLTVAEVATLHLGLMKFLLDQVNRISGLDADIAGLSALAEEPLTRAAFLLSQEFGWSPREIGELTLGQVLLHLQMLTERAQA
jgi:hypothetical protein